MSRLEKLRSMTGTPAAQPPAQPSRRAETMRAVRAGRSLDEATEKIVGPDRAQTMRNVVADFLTPEPGSLGEAEQQDYMRSDQGRVPVDLFNRALDEARPIRGISDYFEPSPIAGAVQQKVGGLAGRAGKQFGNKAILEDIEKARPSSGAVNAVTNMLAWQEEAERLGLSPEGEKVTFWEGLKAVPKLVASGWLAALKPEHRAKAVQTQQALEKERGSVAFDVEPAETKAEKAVDITAGLGAFISRVMVAKKLLPSGTVLPDAVAWEIVTQMDGGLPGEGATTRGALGAIGQIPTASLAGKVGKTAAESALFAGKTAAQGGSGEDIAIAALLPVAFNAWSIKQQQKYLRDMDSTMRRAAYDRHHVRVKQGMPAKMSARLLRQEAGKIKDVMHHVKRDAHRQPADAFAPQRQGMTAQQAAQKLMDRGYRFGEPGKTHKQLSQIKAPKQPDAKTLRQRIQSGVREARSELNEVLGPSKKPLPGGWHGKEQVVVVRSAEGAQKAVYPSGTTFQALPNGWTATTEALPQAPAATPPAAPPKASITEQPEAPAPGVEETQEPKEDLQPKAPDVQVKAAEGQVEPLSKTEVRSVMDKTGKGMAEVLKMSPAEARAVLSRQLSTKTGETSDVPEPARRILLALENSLDEFSDYSVAPRIQRDATRLLDDASLASEIAAKYAKAAEKGQVQGGPKEVRTAPADVAAIARAARIVLSSHDMSEVTPKTVPDEVATPPEVTTEAEQKVSKDVATKSPQPWEMTREEYQQIHRAEQDVQAAFKIGDEVIPTGRIHDWNQVPSGLQDVGQQQGFVSGFVDNSGAFVSVKDAPSLRRAHYDAVMQAVSEGKPVPRNVLEEYQGAEWADQALKKNRTAEPVLKKTGENLNTGEGSATVEPVTEDKGVGREQQPPNPERPGGTKEEGFSKLDIRSQSEQGRRKVIAAASKRTEADPILSDQAARRKQEIENDQKKLRELREQAEPFAQTIREGEQAIRARFRGQPNAKRLTRKALHDADDFLTPKERTEYDRLTEEIRALKASADERLYGTPYEQERRRQQKREAHRDRIRSHPYLDAKGHLNNAYLGELDRWAEANGLEIAEYTSAAGNSQYITIKQIEPNHTRTELLKIRLSDHISGQLSASAFREPDIDLEVTDTNIADIVMRFEEEVNEALASFDRTAGQEAPGIQSPSKQAPHQPVAGQVKRAATSQPSETAHDPRTIQAFNAYWAEASDKPDNIQDAVLEYLADSDPEFQRVENDIADLELGPNKDEPGTKAEVDRLGDQLEAVRNEMVAKVAEAQAAAGVTDAPPVKKTLKQAVDEKRVGKLRDLADRMDSQIEAKLNPAIGQQNVTARRASIAGNMMEQGRRMQEVQQLLRAIADRIEAGDLPESLAKVKTKADAETVLAQTYSPPWMHKSVVDDALKAIKGKPGAPAIRDALKGVPRHGAYGYEPRTAEQLKAMEQLTRVARKHGARLGREDLAQGKRFWALGIRSQADLDKARNDARSLLKPAPKDSRTDQKIREKTAALIGVKIPGFFPTPATVGKRMVESAEIEEGMKVLEPSAGKGDLADVIKQETGIAPDTVETSSSLGDILALKGYQPVARDFMEFEGKYDRIVMNPPYEKGQDIEHVRHAYDLLEPGGRVVALMSEGSFTRSDKKATQFREWLEEVDGTSERLPAKSFTGKESFRQTGVSVRMVVIEKPATHTAHQPSPGEGSGSEAPGEPRDAETQGSAFTESKRRAAMGKTTKAIKNHPLYTLAQEQASEESFTSVGLTRYYIPERYKGEVEAYAGEKRTAAGDYKSELGQYVTHDKNRGQHWDEAAQEMGWPGDINGFLERLKGAVAAQGKTGKTKFDQALAEQAAQGGDPELELLLLKRNMLADREDVGDINAAISKALQVMQEDYGLDSETVTYLRQTHSIGSEGPGYQVSVGAASINWKSRRNAVDRAIKASGKLGRPMYVVQGSTGKFQTRPKPPAKGHYTLVDMSQPIRDQVRYVKQASPTIEEAFDYGEHPKVSQRHLSKLQQFKNRLKAENADLIAIGAELFDYVRKNVPKADQHRFLSILQRVNPKARTKTNLKDLGKVIAKTEEVLRGNDKRAAIAELKATWKKIQKDYRRGQAKLGKLDKAARDRIEKLMGGIQLKDISAVKRVQLETLGRRISKLARELGTTMQQIDPATGAMLLDVPEARIKEMARLGQTSIRSMTADDIRAITSTLKYIVHQYETSRQIFEENEARERDAVLKAMLDEVVPTKEAVRRTARDLEGLPQEIRKPARKVARRVLKTDSAHLDTLAELMTRSGDTQTRRLFSDALNDGWRKRADLIRRAIVMIEEGVDEIGFTHQDFKALQKDTVEIESGAVKRKVPVEYVMDLYMHLQNPDNVERFMTTTGHRLKGELLPAFKDLAQLNQAVDQLSDKQRAFCDLYTDLNNEILAPGINEVALRLEGYELATNPNHWRIHRALPSKMSGRISDVAIEDSGPFQPRTGGTQRIEIRPFTQEVVNNIQTAATYYGMAVPMRNLRSIVNTSEWQDAMRKAGHQDLVSAALTILRRVQGYRTDQSVAEMAGQKLLSKFARSVLGLRISTVGNQILSAPVAQSEIKPRYFLKALTKAQVLARVKKMKELSPVLWERWTGKKINVEVGSLMAQHTMETLVWDKSPILEKPMKGLVWGDQAAIAHIHAAAEAETRALHPELKGEAFDEAVIRRTEYVTRRTQPMWDMLNRSVLSGSPSLWLRLGLMFRSAREKQWNVLLRANNSLAKGGGKGGWQYSQEVGGVIAANALIAAWKWGLRYGLYTGSVAALVALGVIDPDDKEGPSKGERRRLAGKLAEDTAGNLLSLMPGGQHLQSGLKLALKRTRGEHVWKAEPYDDPIGQMFADSYSLAFDKGPQIAQEIASQERFQSGPRKGELKWRGHAEDAAAEAAIVVAQLAGVPLPGPTQELYWPVQRALREHENPYRMMTNPEKLLALADVTYADSRKTALREPDKWVAHEGKEEKAERIKRALKDLTPADFTEWSRLSVLERQANRARSQERRRRVKALIQQSQGASR